MGYYLYIGKLPGENASMSYEDVLRTLQAHPECRMITPEMDPHYDEPFFIFDFGRLDIVKNPPKDGSLQAPWISARTSWAASEAGFRTFVGLLLELAGILQMTVIDGYNVRITRESLESVATDFSKQAEGIVDLFGRTQSEGDSYTEE